MGEMFECVLFTASLAKVSIASQCMIACKLGTVSEFNDNNVCKPFIKNLTLTLYKTVLFIQGDDYLSDCFYSVAVC